MKLADSWHICSICGDVKRVSSLSAHEWHHIWTASRMRLIFVELVTPTDMEVASR